MIIITYYFLLYTDVSADGFILRILRQSFVNRKTPRSLIKDKQSAAEHSRNVATLLIYHISIYKLHECGI